MTKWITALFFIGGLLTSSSTDAQTVTLNLQKVPIQKVFREISRQTNISIVYNEAIFKDFLPVTITVTDEPVKDVLNKCLGNQPFSYIIEGNTILIKKIEKSKQADGQKTGPKEPVALNGIVKSEKGEPLVNASVILKPDIVGGKGLFSKIANSVATQVMNDVTKESIKGAYSNNNGEFSFPDLSPGKYRITITSIGYEKNESKVTIGKDAVYIPIVLKEHVEESAKEAVVNGIYSRPKANYTGAASAYTGDQLRQVSPTNLLQALRTLDASFQMPPDNVNGSNPNVVPRVQLRGSNSIAQTDATTEYGYISNPPLIILDGFEITLQRLYDLDINTIAKITVLKDAAATAIYGSKSANGVLVVETKKPKPGEALVSYSTSLTFTEPDLGSFTLMDAAQKLQFEQTVGLYKSKNISTQSILTDQYNLVLHNVQRGVNTYWLSQPLQPQFDHAHTLSIGAGGKSFVYLANLTYNHNGGIMIGSSRDNLAGNVSLNYSSARFKFNTQFTIGSIKTNNSPYGDFSQYAQLNPYWAPRDQSGRVAQYVDQYPVDSVNGGLANLAAHQPTLPNPLWDASVGVVLNKGNQLDIGQNFWAEWNLTKDLKVNGSFSYYQSNTGTDNFLPGTASEFFGVADFSQRGSYTQNTGKALSYQGSANLNFGKVMGKHALFATLGMNMTENSSQQQVISVTGFPSSRMNDLLFGLQYSDTKPSGSYTINRTVGFYGNTSYAYDNRYLLDLSLRSDGSSVFGSDKRFGTLWSVGGGWNLHKEKFYKLPSFISQFKLRGSYGFTGSVNFPSYASTTTYQYQVTGRYLNYIPTVAEAVGNPDLVWQRTKKFNGGADIGLFKDRMTINFNYYVETTDNLITTAQTPPSTGFGSYYNNLGSVQNKGYDFGVNLMILRKPEKKLFWSVSTSWLHNENKILTLDNSLKAASDSNVAHQQQGLISLPVLQYKPGQSISTIYAVRSLGIDPSTGREILLTADGKQTYIWNAADEVAIGDNQPKFNITLNNQFQYKWLKLNFGLVISAGGYSYNNTLAGSVDNADPTKNVDQRALNNRWIKPGDVALYRGLTDIGGYPLPRSGTEPSSRFIKKNNQVEVTGLSIDPGALIAKYINKYVNKFVGKASDKLNEGVKGTTKSDLVDVKFYMNNLIRFSSVQRQVGTSYPFSRSFTLKITVRL